MTNITIILATSNKGKAQEFCAFTQNSKRNAGGNKIIFKTINEIYDGEFNPEETGLTFAENALIKAQAAAAFIKDLGLVRQSVAKTEVLVLADDSGIEIESLGGRPGIYAARYFKEHGLAGILEELGTKPNRRARFVCHLTLVDTNGKVVFETEKYWHGNITNGARGSNGFGYDPIVVPDEYTNENKTVAELTDQIKSTLSHRAKALIAVLDFLN